MLLSKLVAALKSEVAQVNAQNVIWSLELIGHNLSDNFIKDGNALNAVVDTIVQSLQEIKVPVDDSSQPTN